MVSIVYQGHQNRTKRAMKNWLKVLEMFNGGVSATDIAKKFSNSRSWVYWVLRKFKENKI